MIQVEGVVRTPGGVFALAMPFFEHDDFRQVMKTLTLAGVAAYTKSLLTALAHVHAEGVIHRDIKPRNFMYNSKTGKGACVCVCVWIIGCMASRDTLRTYALCVLLYHIYAAD